MFKNAWKWQINFRNSFASSQFFSLEPIPHLLLQSLLRFPLILLLHHLDTGVKIHRKVVRAKNQIFQFNAFFGYFDHRPSGNSSNVDILIYSLIESRKLSDAIRWDRNIYTARDILFTKKLLVLAFFALEFLEIIA